MTLSRRDVLALGGGGIATSMIGGGSWAAAIMTIEMRGTPRGEHIWFDPVGMVVPPGSTIRFLNNDPGNSHTATAYHPMLFGRPQRIPDAAEPWNSEFLLPGGVFEVRLDHPGVYDYYCIPHETHGMVGRLVVGAPADVGWQDVPLDPADLPPAALENLPSVAAILEAGRISSR